MPPAAGRQLKLLTRDEARRIAAKAAGAVTLEGQRLDETVDGWRAAMTGVGKLPAVSREIQSAFLNVWSSTSTCRYVLGIER